MLCLQPSFPGSLDVATMTEPLGIATGVIALGEGVGKVCKLIAKASAAPEDWRRYHSELQTVEHVRYSSFL
jgi:hypothetical protein